MIFDLCLYVFQNFLKNSQVVKVSLVKACISCINSLLIWIPLSYIFLSNLIDKILLNLLSNGQFRLAVLRCLVQISSLRFDSVQEQSKTQLKEKVYTMWGTFLQKFNGILPCNMSFQVEREKLKNQPQNFVYFETICSLLAQFFNNLFQAHLVWLDPLINSGNVNSQEGCEIMKKSLFYMLRITELREPQVFKICVEFWKFLTEFIKKNGA